jgi:peptidyl-dipeptidase A
MKDCASIALLLTSLVLFLGMVQGLAAEDPEPAARALIGRHEAAIRPLEKAVNLAWWKANVTGKDEDFKAKEEAQNRLDAAMADRARFAEIQALRRASIANPPLKRQVEVLYLQYLEKQLDPELMKKMVAKANTIEQAFNVFRARVDGREMTDSEARRVLKESRDSARRRVVWEAGKAVGGNVRQDLAELVALRNQAARQLGFADYHVMMLHLNEQDQGEVEKLFDELDLLTREPFRKAKAEIDSRLAERYGIQAADLRPWHYHDPFFQESPAVFATDLDSAYRDVDVPKLCRDYYASMGLPVDDVLQRSDLYEKPGKSPHAFCTDIDREGDVRVLANIVPNHYWMGTMLHELGHAVYSSKNIPNTMPYVLRRESHILTTEGVAMLFERAANSADWLEKMGVKVADPKAFNEIGARMRRNQLLIFSRWCQVMFRFEKAMYANPKRDLNQLWWDLVERYQMVKRPEGRNAPDYASKIHIVSAPAYYHNYMMGELFASQVHHTIAEKVLLTTPAQALFVGKPEVGRYMREKIFGPGASMSWNELTRFATGAALNPRAFAADFTE